MTKLTKKKALGKGLGALISAGGGTASGSAASVAPGARLKDGYMLCPVGDITANKKQPRRHFEQKSLAELSDSIRQKGVIEPLIVRRKQNGYELIAGERRWRAARMAGLAEVPVVARDCNDEESLELAIIENIQREDLNAIEEAEAFYSLTGFGLSQEQVAKKVGKDRATVANYLRLLKLPSEVKDELAGGAISMGHARAMLSLSGHAAQRELCKLVVTRGLSVRETERLAGDASERKKLAHGKAKHTPLHIGALEDELRKIFNTKVSVVEGKGKGKIEIEYYSSEERERIIELLRSV